MHDLRRRVRNRFGLDNLHAGLHAATVAEGTRLQHSGLRNLQAAIVPGGATGDAADASAGHLYAAADTTLFAADLHTDFLHTDILHAHLRSVRRDDRNLLSAGDCLSPGNHLGGSAELGTLYFLPATLDGDGLPDFVRLLRHNVHRAGHFLCFGMRFLRIERSIGVGMQFVRVAATRVGGGGSLLSGHVEFGFSSRRHAESAGVAGRPGSRQSRTQDIREADSTRTGASTKTPFDTEADSGEQHAEYSGAEADRPLWPNDRATDPSGFVFSPDSE